MTHRFFIPPDWFTPPTVYLRGNLVHQIKTVLRLQPAEEIVVLDNSGQEWRVQLTDFGRAEIRGQLVATQPTQGEPTVYLTLYQGTLKGQKFESVLQKGTELGVCRFVPTLCQRSVVSKQADLTPKQARWERIIQEAAEQSRRGRLPVLAPAAPLVQAIRQASQEAPPDSLLLLPWEEASEPSLKTVLTAVKPTSVAVFIGPEGGFTTEEAVLARQAGIHLVTLGPRILRAETAGLAVCSAILYELGEWDSSPKSL